MDSDRPRVLVFAYFFPPLGGAGTQRVLKFVKYLPEHGYDPVVLTTRSRSYPVHDESLFADVPAGVPVLRAPEIPLPRFLSIGFDTLRLPLLRDLAAWPDEAWGWIPGAIVQGVRAVRRLRPAVLFSSSAPYSAHIVAAEVSWLTGVPWVADFRDEWSANPHIPQRAPLRRLSERVERRIMVRARRVVTVADYFRIAGDGAAAPTRVTVTNGVDPDDLAALGRPAAPDDRFRIAFVGTLYTDRNTADVLGALRRLAAAGAIDPERVELRVVGNVWSRDPLDAGSVPVVKTGYVDHARALAEMRAASVLLFITGELSPMPTGKLYEYLAAERPILCIARRDNLAYELVSEWGAGRCAEPGDAAAVEEAIRAFYADWERGALPDVAGVREKVFARFSRRELTGRLASVLDAARGAAA